MPENFFRWLKRNREWELDLRRRGLWRNADGLPADAPPPAASPRRVRRRHTVYALQHNGRVLYVGQSTQLEQRIAQHRRGDGHTKRQRRYLAHNLWEPVILAEGLSERQATTSERFYIRRYRPPANTQWRK